VINYSRFVYEQDWLRYGVRRYEDYLQSDLWRDISSRMSAVRASAPARCITGVTVTPP
jgi:hypothetical protein